MFAISRRMRCVTCRQQLSEGTETHPAYFSQYGTTTTGKPPLVAAMDFTKELENILGYLEALTTVMPEAEQIDENLVSVLTRLARELAEEAERHRAWLEEELDALYEAGKEG